MTGLLPVFVEEIDPASGKDRRGRVLAGQPLLPDRFAGFGFDARSHARVGDHEQPIADQQRRTAAGNAFAEFPGDVAVGDVARAVGPDGEQLPAAGRRWWR